MDKHTLVHFCARGKMIFIHDKSLIMTQKFSLWDEMCENICSANKEQMIWLMKQTGFKYALNQISPENLANMGEAVFDLVLPHLDVGADLLAEAAHWLSVNDTRYQNVAQKLIQKHAEQETSSSHDTVLKVRTAALKYNQNPSDLIMKRFAQAYEHQHSIEQAKRIAAELPQSTTIETVKPIKTHRKL